MKRMFEIHLEGAIYIEANSDGIVALLENAAIGFCFEIKIIEMEEKDFASLPEYQGA